MIMSVDLSLGNQGIVTLEGGAKFFCPMIEERDDNYRVRIESGWYNIYARDGRAVSSGTVYRKNGTTENVVGRSIVEFIPCKWEDPRCDGLLNGTCP
jgi:hypothetical protein